MEMYRRSDPPRSGKFSWNLGQEQDSARQIQHDQRINGGVQRMVTHKRGTVACLFTAAVLFAFTTLGFAQSNESGYTSKYLAHTSPAKLKANADNATARTEAIKQNLGADKHDAKPFFAAALKEQKKNRNLLLGGNGPAGKTAWISLGPTKTNHIQNGISQNRVDSGRMRSILPNPNNPDVVYL